MKLAGEDRPLSETDIKIAQTVAPTLKEKGLIFVGLDVIGDFSCAGELF